MQRMHNLLLSPIQQLILTVNSFVLGSVVGSFLNVCIYRLPRGLSVASPARSFCPSCKTTLSCADNIPILGWLLLKGKCRYCKEPIASRYAIVELLTGLLFLAAWLTAPPAVALVGFVFFAILIVATFVDLEFQIIPPQVTLGGVVAGLALSTLFPEVLGQSTHLEGALQSLVGAAAGFLAVFGFLELGKLLFGKIRSKLPVATSFSWEKNAEGAPILTMGGDKEDWDEIFVRDSNRLRLVCPDLQVAGFPPGKGVVVFGPKGLDFQKRFIPYCEVESVRGKVSVVTQPREAMGVGDIKLMAAIGAFVGWKGAMFSLAFSSFFGIFAFLAIRVWIRIMLHKTPPPSKIAYGPYIALAAVTWWFSGPAMVQWYLTTFFHHQ